MDAEDYFIGPDIDITRLHILQPGDLLTAIRIPSTWAGAQFYFEKVRDRNVWDFPLLNVASAMVVSNGTIERMRIAVNGAAARPLRLKAVEDAVRGKPPTPPPEKRPENWRSREPCRCNSTRTKFR